MFWVKCDCLEAQVNYWCPYFLNSLTGEDEQDGSIATAVNIGSEKCILWILNELGFLEGRQLPRWASHPSLFVLILPVSWGPPFKFGDSFFFSCSLTLLIMTFLGKNPFLESMYLFYMTFLFRKTSRDSFFFLHSLFPNSLLAWRGSWRGG